MKGFSFFEHISVSVASRQSGSFPGEWFVNLDMSVCCSSVSAAFNFLVTSLQFWPFLESDGVCLFNVNHQSLINKEGLRVFFAVGEKMDGSSAFNRNLISVSKGYETNSC